MSSDSEIEQQVMEVGSDDEELSMDSGSGIDEQEEGSASEEEAEDNANSDEEDDDEEDDDDDEEDDDDDEEDDDESGEEDDDEVDSDSEGAEKKPPKENKKQKKIPFDQPKNTKKANLLEKYERLKGKSLYVRFPHTLPVDQTKLEKDVKALCNRILKVRRPRQKSTRFCLVDFDSAEDRAKAMKELKDVEINGKKLHIEIPRTEKEDFVEQLLEKRAKKEADLKAKTKLKKLAKKTQQEEEKKQRVFTSTLILQNIPLGTTVGEIKGLFPKAIDIKVNFAKGNQATSTATVTMPTPKDATYVQRKKYKLGENQLKISFDVPRKKKDKTNKAKKQNGQSSGPQSPKKNKNKLEPPSSEDSPSPKKYKHKLEAPSSEDSPSPKKMEANIKVIKQQENKTNKNTKNIQGKNLKKKFNKKDKKVVNIDAVKLEEDKVDIPSRPQQQKNNKNKNKNKNKPTNASPQIGKKQKTLNNPITQKKEKKKFNKVNKAGKPFKNKNIKAQ